MAFKLGQRSGPMAIQGNILQEHSFKVVREDLEDGVVGEARDANTVVIDSDVEEGSELYERAIIHEGIHAKEMAEGKIAYGPNYVRADGVTYPRKDGKIKYNGEWYEEGSEVFPWEQRAMNAENYV